MQMNNIDIKKFQLIIGAVEAGNICEKRSLEFKPGFNWFDPSSNKIKEETIKAIIAMANTRQGGSIVLGIEEKQGKKLPIIAGIDAQYISTFEKQFESFQETIKEYFSHIPNCVFYKITTNNVGNIKFDEPRNFVIIEVSEFDIYPILCIKSGIEIEGKGPFKVIHQGFLYVRSKSPKWSSCRPKTNEFEELIQMAADKYRDDLANKGYTKVDNFLEKRLNKEKEIYGI